MRFAQLARKLEVEQHELERFLNEEHNILEISGPNFKIEEEIVNSCKSHFNYKKPSKKVVDQSQEKESEVIQEEIEVEEFEEIEEEIPHDDSDYGINENIDEEAASDIFDVDEKIIDEPIEVSEEAQAILDRYDPDTGVIKSPKVELEGIKVKGKIDLPEPKVKMEEEIISKEEKKEEGIKIEKKTKKKKLSYEEKRKREEIRLAKQEKKANEIKQKALKEQKTKHYQENFELKGSTKKKKKTKKVDQFEEQLKQNKEYSDSLLGRFRKWLNGG